MRSCELPEFNSRRSSHGRDFWNTPGSAGSPPRRPPPPPVYFSATEAFHHHAHMPLRCSFNVHPPPTRDHVSWTPRGASDLHPFPFTSSGLMFPPLRPFPSADSPCPKNEAPALPHTLKSNSCQHALSSSSASFKSFTLRLLYLTFAVAEQSVIAFVRGAMNNSLRLCRTTGTCINVNLISSQQAASGNDVVSSVSFPPVSRIHGTQQPTVQCLSTVRNQFLGSKVGARNAHVGQSLGTCVSNGSKWSASTWLDNKASVDTEISAADAYELWNDREKIPRWMKWIDNVTVSKEKPDFSKWTLKYRAFEQDFEFAWLSRNMEPELHQKIHWRSVDGLPNKGEVRFIPLGPNACTIELTISYELPDLVAPLGTAVEPIVEGVLKEDLNRFAEMTKSNQLASV